MPDGRLGPLERCIEVDGDKDGDTTDHDVPNSVVEAILGDFRGFIMRYGGSGSNPLDITPFTKLTVGGTTSENRLVFTVSGIVGYLAHTISNPSMQQFLSYWNRISWIQLRGDRGPHGEAAALWWNGSYTHPGYGIQFFSERFGSITTAADFARALFHEPWPHQGVFSSHEALDAWARNATTYFGLGRCHAVGGFRGC
jgi:hypothetical protein